MRSSGRKQSSDKQSSDWSIAAISALAQGTTSRLAQHFQALEPAVELRNHGRRHAVVPCTRAVCARCQQQTQAVGRAFLLAAVRRKGQQRKSLHPVAVLAHCVTRFVNARRMQSFGARGAA